MSAATEPVTTRPTRCTCGASVPVGTPTRSLAFFESRGPGDVDYVCSTCRYYKEAHERKQRENPPHLSRVCDEFTPMVEGYEFDLYYCGHGGWD